MYAIRSYYEVLKVEAAGFVPEPVDQFGSFLLLCEPLLLGLVIINLYDCFNDFHEDVRVFFFRQLAALVSLIACPADCFVIGDIIFFSYNFV